MPTEMRYGEMAGTGIIKTGTTFSINPVQKLRIVTVTDRLTVPDEFDLPDSAASVGYVNTCMARSGRLHIGRGLTIDKDKGSVSVSKKQILEQISLTEPPVNDTDVATVTHVKGVVAKYALKTEVQEIASTLVSRDFVRNHVNNALAQTVTTLNENLASKTHVSNEISRAASVQQDATKALVTDTLQEGLDRAVAPLVSQIDLESRLVGLATTTLVQDELDRALTPLISKNDLEDRLVDLATKTLVTDTVQERLEHAIAPLLSKGDLESRLSEVASVSYVTETVSNAIQQAADDAGSKTGRIRFATPADADSLQIVNEEYLLLHPSGTLNSLTVSLPTAPELNDGRRITIATSQDINELKLIHLPTVGGMTVPETITITAGSSLHFIYTAEGQCWFSL